MKSGKNVARKKQKAKPSPGRPGKHHVTRRGKRITQVAAAQTTVASVVPVQASGVERMPGPPRKDRPWLWYGATALTVVFLIVFSVFVFRMMTTIEQQNQQLVVSGRAFRELNSRFVELRNELTRKEELLRVLSARRIDVADLRGFGVSSVAYGKIFWDTERHSAILQVSNLPVVPEGREYQLWMLKGKRQASAGVFAVTAGGSSFFRIDNLPVLEPAGPAQFAVTLEQKGGSAHPAGAVYLTGTAQL
jgi:hypothetical protein